MIPSVRRHCIPPFLVIVRDSYLNPMAGIIDGLRWCMIGTSFSPYIWVSLTSGLALFVTGFYYFCFVERKMADFL